jgi:hypothetical protein
MFTVSKTYQTLRSITDLKEVNKKDCYKLSLDINMEYYKIIIPDYKVSRTINLW